MFFTHGWVHVIAGCMFCGKTDEMLRLLRRFSIAGREVVLVKPRLDTRTDEVTVVSRDHSERRDPGRSSPRSRSSQSSPHSNGRTIRLVSMEARRRSQASP